MAQTFFFYDLETSGLNPRQDRIMQFAGRRTDMELKPIGEPINVLVALNDDTLPSPDALMVTGITPQKTVEEGYSEAEFAKIVVNEIFTPETVAVGFNNVRFDDEFIRYLLWRNFHDPYEWSWKDGRSRWDMLDVVRMTRALRPEGIKWPVDENGQPTNRLELITQTNGISHENAHDAMSDVNALIDVTKLIRDKQPQLFNYSFTLRDKNEVKKFVSLDEKKPFVYVSGRYDNQWNKATVALPIAPVPNSNVLVYDLRYDPAPFVGLSEEELAKKIFATWQERQAEGFVALPVKVLQYNRCPAVAPLGVLEQSDGWQKISLDAELVQEHQKILLEHPDFAEKVRTIFENKPEFKKLPDPEAQLYDGFLHDKDRIRVEAVRNATERELTDFSPEFGDERLPELLLHYKARSFPKTLSEEEMTKWEAWREAHLKTQLPKYLESLRRLAVKYGGDGDKEFMLQELQLWAEAVLPGDI